MKTKRYLIATLTAALALSACNSNEQANPTSTSTAPAAESTPAPTTTSTPATTAPETTTTTTTTTTSTITIASTVPPTTQPVDPTQSVIDVINLDTELFRQCYAALPNCDTSTFEATEVDPTLGDTVRFFEERNNAGYTARNVDGFVASASEVVFYDSDTATSLVCITNGVAVLNSDGSIHDDEVGHFAAIYQILLVDGTWKIFSFTYPETDPEAKCES